MNPSGIRPPERFALRAHPHLYEINTWAWLEQLTARLGRTVRLMDVPDAEWNALAQRGFDIVWLMGVWQRSPASRRIALADPANVPLYDRALPDWKPEDVVGSPYAVAQYVPDPRIGDWNALDAVREKLHARNMALFLDFVGNHTALDHPWTREHPEYYVQGREEDFRKDPSSFTRVETPGGAYFLARARDLYLPPWKDAAQLNHFEPRMRAAQLADLRTIASHCDGVRCDMAMLHLHDIFEKIWGHLLSGARPPAQEFWTEAHAALPGLVLLAEAYWGTEQRLLDLGFSFAYDKDLYDAVRDIRISEVRERLAAGIGYQSHLVRFLENHDERRCADVFGKERLASVAALMGTLPGMRFYHQGQLEGCATSLPITLRIGAPVSPDPATAALFENILRVTKENAFHEGAWNLLPATPRGDATSGNLIAYEWRSEGQWKVIAVNLSDVPSEGQIRFGERALPAQEYVFDDELNGVRYFRRADDLLRFGLFVRRDGFGAHLFDVAPV
jgi:hypothetical protein